MTSPRMRLLSGWTIGRVDAEVIYAELERIRRHGGLVAERVIAAATPEGHALHPAFEWDDGKAAGDGAMAAKRFEKSFDGHKAQAKMDRERTRQAKQDGEGSQERNRLRQRASQGGMDSGKKGTTDTGAKTDQGGTGDTPGGRK